MSFIKDVEAALLIARAFGLAPYSIKTSSISVSKHAILYSVLWIMFYLYALFNRVVIYFTEDVDTKFRMLSVTRTILVVSALLLDITLSISIDKKLQSTFAYVRKFDIAVKYDVATSARKLRMYNRIIFGVMVIYFFVIGWSIYIYERYESLMAALIYVYLYLPLAISVMKFVTLVSSIFMRFYHLNQMLFPGTLSIVTDMDHGAKRLHLRDIGWLHNCLYAAVQDINSLFSVQLFLWFTNFIFNTISRIHAFMESGSTPNILILIRDGGLVLVFALLAFLITSICHSTSFQANKVSTIVFSPGSRYFNIHIEQDSKDKFSIGQYFASHKVHFTAGFGFFRVDLPLLLKITGTMTTYLVILKSPSKC